MLKRPALQLQTSIELDLNRYVPAIILWLSNKLSADASKCYREWFDLGITDWRVLAYLGVKERGTGAQIAEFMGLDKAAVSRSISVLKKAELIKLVQLKGRKVEASLTAKGERKYREILEIALAREEALLRGFSTKERDMLVRFCHRLLANLPSVSAVVPSASKRGN